MKIEIRVFASPMCGINWWCGVSCYVRRLGISYDSAILMYVYVELIDGMLHQSVCTQCGLGAKLALDNGMGIAERASIGELSR